MSGMNLLGTLGLNEVEADPNAIPVGTYDAVIYKSELVLNKDKDTISHVITFKVDGGTHNGAEQTQWNKLGDAPRNAADEFPAKVSEIAKYSPTMGDRQKSYYKKTWVDCGFAEQEVGMLPPEAMVGRKVTIRVYENNGFKNVAVNGPRTDAAATSPVAGQSNGVIPTF